MCIGLHYISCIFFVLLLIEILTFLIMLNRYSERTYSFALWPLVRGLLGLDSGTEQFLFVSSRVPLRNLPGIWTKKARFLFLARMRTLISAAFVVQSRPEVTIYSSKKNDQIIMANFFCDVDFCSSILKSTEVDLC